MLTGGSWWLSGSEVGVLTECENVWTMFFAIAETPANELLGNKKWHTLHNPRFYLEGVALTFVSWLTRGLGGNSTSVAFSIVFCSSILACERWWPNGCRQGTLDELVTVLYHKPAVPSFHKDIGRR